MTRRSIKLIVGGLFFAFTAFICVDTFLPMILVRAPERNNRVKCARNLKHIGNELHIFSRNRYGEFPPSLSALYPRHIPGAKVFLCPSAKKAVAVGKNKEAFGEENIDYAYVSGLSSKDPPDLVLAHDKAGNHDGGRNVLFIGGNVEWMKEEEFQAALKKTREHLEAKERRSKNGAGLGDSETTEGEPED